MNKSGALVRIILPPLVALLAGCGASPALKAADPPPVVSDWSAPADFDRLRADYGDREDFFQLCEKSRPVGQLFELAQRQQWDDALAVTERWLTTCPVDIDMHAMAGMALRQLGRQPESDQHVRWYRGLVDSVRASGDGRTPKTAYVVISVAEEYAVLRALGLRLNGQALTKERMDAMSVESPDGPTTVYFNPAAHFRRLGRALKKNRN